MTLKEQILKVMDNYECNEDLMIQELARVIPFQPEDAKVMFPFKYCS